MPDVHVTQTAADDAPSPSPAGPHPARGRSGLRPDLVLVAVVAGGFVLRFWRLGAQSLWYDEWLTTEATAGGLGDLVHHVATREGITPPYFVAMWAWARVVGDGDTALRSLSAVVGVATVPVAYAIARELGQARRVARGAALLVAVNPLLVWYSQEARPYSLLAFLGALSVLAALRADRRGGRPDVLWWGLAGAAAVATHYFAAFLVAGEAVALLARRRVSLRLVALGCAPVGLLLAAMAPFAIEQHSHAANRDWIAGFALSARLEEAGRSALVGPNPAGDRLWLVPAAVVVVALALTVGRVGGGDRRIAGGLALVGAVAVVLPLGAALAGTDVFLVRYLLAATVPLVVAVAVLLLAGTRAWVGATAVLVVAGVWLAADVAVARDPGLQRADWRAVAAVADSGSPDRVLIVDTGGGQSNPLRRYLPGAAPLAEDETVLVDQIDVLVGRPAGAPCNFYVGRACAFVFLGGPLPAPVAERFHLEERHQLDQFVVERYRADEPVELGPPDLVDPTRQAQAYVWAAVG
jgi:mannosyltransferase